MICAVNLYTNNLIQILKEFCHPKNVAGPAEWKDLWRPFVVLRLYNESSSMILSLFKHGTGSDTIPRVLVTSLSCNGLIVSF